MVHLKLIRLLAVILALVVPVQGIAGLTAGICMSMGHHQAAAVDHGHDENGNDSHDHAMHSHSDGDKASAADGEGKSHCGPCAACCASASIAGSVALPMSASPFHPHYNFSQYPPLGVEPNALYRPPLAL